MVDWGPLPFCIRKGFPSTGNFDSICSEEGKEYFPVPEKLKLKWKMKTSQGKPVTMSTVWSGVEAGIT